MPSILLSGPAGANKSALARRLLAESPEQAAIADFQLVYRALTDVERGRDGRYPLRDDRLLPLTEYIRRAIITGALARDITVIATNSDGAPARRAFTALDFNRPPAGGSVAGMSDGLAAPPFPPGLASDPSLFLGVWLAGDPDVAELPSGFDVADKQALTVDSTAGVYFPSTERLAATVAGDEYAVFLAGPRILTADDLPGRPTLFADMTDYTRSNSSTVYRQMTLSRAPARGRGLELVITNASRSLTAPLYIGTTDDWLALGTLAATQLDGLVSGGTESIEHTIPVKTVSFGESNTDSFGHGIVYVGRVNDTRIGIAFAQNRGIGDRFRMTVREIP